MIRSKQEPTGCDMPVAQMTVLISEADYLLATNVLFPWGDDLTLESVGLTLKVEEIYDRVRNEEMAEYLAGRE